MHHQLWYHKHKLLAACMAMLVLAQLSAQAQLPLVCVVIRTYFAHGTYGNSALMNLLHSLKKQEHTRWVAMLLVMDNRPFPDLRHIVRDAADERIQVFAEWISAQYQPKTADGMSWSNDYHSKLYNLTDEAIRACPKSTSWLMVTNGDNDYDPKFMAAIVQQPAGTEVVAFDYYSRFQRSTGLPCERFAAGPGLPPCKENLLRWCQTDLAANVYWWPRFVADDMLFGVLDSGRGANHDGFMAEVVVKRNWKVAHVSGRCLVEHSPSPQLCASLGGVWDDSFAGSDAEAGGKCLEASRAAKKLALLGAEGEMVTVALSHDVTSFGLTSPVLEVECLRLASADSLKAMSKYFPKPCQAKYDTADWQQQLQQQLQQQQL